MKSTTLSKLTCTFVLLTASAWAAAPSQLALGLPSGARPVAIEMDTQGAMYIAGSIWNTAVIDATTPKSVVDSFVAKYDPKLKKLVYLTKFGSAATFTQNSLAVDASGAAYLTADATAFPITIPASTASGTIVAKIGSSGQIVYSRLIPGATHGGGVAVNAKGEVYVTGTTDGPTQNPLPTPGAAATAPGPSFVVKLDASGASILLAERGIGGVAIALDPQDNIYVSGEVVQAYNPPLTPTSIPSSFGSCSASFFTGAGACGHQHVAKLDPSGSTLIYGVFVTGANGSRPSSITADAQGNAYLTGFTSGPDYPVTPGAVQATYAKSQPSMQELAPRLTFSTKPPEIGFLTEVNPDGTNLIFSTYLGSPSPIPSDSDPLNVVTRDSVTKVRLYNSQVYVAGFTKQAGFPGLDAFQPRCLPAAFFMRVASDGGSVDQVHTATAPIVKIVGGTLSSSFILDGQGLAYQVMPDGAIDVIDPTGPDASSSCASDAATFQVTQTIAPGQVLAIFGNALGDTAQAANIYTGLLPTSLGNITVDFDGIPARLLYASSSQVNLMVPYEIAGRTQTTMNIRTSDGANAVKASNMLNVTPRSPSAFKFDYTSTTCGTQTITLVRLANGSIDNCTNPAHGGSIVTFYLDGGGIPGNVAASGQIADQPTKINLPVMLIPNYPSNFSSELPEAVNLSLEPGAAAGIWRLDVRVPTPTGPQILDFQLTIDGVPMPGTLRVWVNP